MIKNIIYLSSFLLAFLGMGSIHASESLDAPLSISIAAPIQQGQRKIELFQGGPHRFHVVLTNISDHPINLWQEYWLCNKNQLQLNFEIVDENGKTWTTTSNVDPKDQNETNRCHEFVATLEPKDHLVLDVSFFPGKGLWDNPPLPEFGKSKTVRMRASYEIKPSKETRAKNIWTGKISSPQEQYTIWRYKQP